MRSRDCFLIIDVLNIRYGADTKIVGSTKELLHKLVGRDHSNALDGYEYWCHPEFEGRTLSDLRNSETHGEDRETSDGHNKEKENPVQN